VTCGVPDLGSVLPETLSLPILKKYVYYISFFLRISNVFLIDFQA
jgi:hypothetical protein